MYSYYSMYTQSRIHRLKLGIKFLFIFYFIFCWIRIHKFRIHIQGKSSGSMRIRIHITAYYVLLPFYRFPLYCLGLLDTNWMTGGGTVTGTFSRWGHGKQTAVMRIRPVIEGSGSDQSQSPLACIRFLPYCRLQYLKKTFKGLRDFKHAVLSSVIPTLKILIAYCWSVEKYVRSKKIYGFLS